ncbi:MAG TPA: hypothetical protein VHU89_00050 [Acidobacteriaceae bacterium]|jgi:hypothetical protein|nr:hypothetical protein [Acidobacteriaceae bacterium]
MKFEEYEARFQADCYTVQMEPGCTVSGPFLEFTVLPDLPPWSMELFIRFPDGMYSRVWEQYDRAAGTPSHGQRLQFALHYGPTPANVDVRGLPLWRSEDRCELRIDLDTWHGPHIHFGGEDHITQNRVKRLDIRTMTPIVFLRGIMEHRSTQRTLPEVFGFEVA